MFYVCHANLGVVDYARDDSLVAISASGNTNLWASFEWEEANEIKCVTGWKIVRAIE